VRRGIPTLIFVLMVIGALGFWAWTLGSAPSQPAPFDAALVARPVPAGGWGNTTAMTANVRISNPSDGPNDWIHRRELVVKTFLKYQPDFLLCQEVTPAQAAYLNKELAQWYAYYPRPGVGKLETSPGTRGAGSGAAAELVGVLNQTLASMNSLYYRSDRYDILDGEAGLILSDELQAVPSENAYFTLAVLKEKGNQRPMTWIVIDVHLRHDLRLAVRCAVRLREKAAAWLRQYPDAAVLLGGDMNHDRASPVYPALASGTVPANFHPQVDGDATGLQLKDAFDYAHKPQAERWGTYHAFNGHPGLEFPSDLLLFAGKNANLVAGPDGPSRILRDQPADHRFPSDHFFVIATFQHP